MYLSDVASADLARAAQQVERSANEVVLILLGENDVPDLDELVAALKATGVPFFGGVFPAVLHEGQVYRRGAIIQTLPMADPPILVTDLDVRRSRLPEALPHYGGDSGGQRGTAFMLLDAYAGHISVFLEHLFNRLGDGYSYLGAGAGNLRPRGERCLFSAEGAFKNAALVALVDWPSRVASRHGWRRMGGPLVATRTKRNVIHDLNWRRALPAYEEVVNGQSSTALDADTFHSVAHRFPFGIFRQGAEDVIRAPIAIAEDGGLVCAGDVDEDTVLYVLEGEKTMLVEAAREAALASFAVPGWPRRGLLADCATRALFLGGDYVDELQAVTDVFAQHGLDAPEGMLTLGEVASSGRGMLEWYNWTVVSSVFYEA